MSKPTPAARELLGILKDACECGLMRPFSVELPDRTMAAAFFARTNQAALWEADPAVSLSGGKWLVRVHRR